MNNEKTIKGKREKLNTSSDNPKNNEVKYVIDIYKAKKHELVIARDLINMRLQNMKD